ncbi:MAG: hypothetical protein M0R30_13680 [Methanoregula sp.]|jgi:hypothetical protein|uniref:hypothetical protein n=1 Tax=Methanoregula sp. TaxID=2052170 RepID=UPI0025EE7078|nr:hypothetical protein [Methanoregula sp.]MCK9632676.1 hypothetical protein [Methanoregula sp.]
MTPGPEPREAIREAITNATARGTALDRNLLREARFRFILFCAGLTVFVQVRRTRVHLTSPEDCAAEYRLDILRLRRVPLNGVVARELWLLSPWGTWQYFRILDDRVIEIRADGTPLLNEDVRVPAPAPVPVPDSVPARLPDSAPEPVPDSVPAPVLDPSPTPVPDPEPDSGTDSVPASEPALIPDSAPARASLPGLSPVGPAPSSDEGG